MKAPARPAVVQSRKKWKKPTRSCTLFHEASTATRLRPKVSVSRISVRPSSARKKLMPSCEIHTPFTWAMTPLWYSAAAVPLTGAVAARSPARAIHCTITMTRGTPVPASAM